MNIKRIYNSILSPIIINPRKRARYFKRKGVYNYIGDNVVLQTKRMPLYPELISIGSNSIIAANVMFITHDVIHNILNEYSNKNNFIEFVGCIEVGENTFIGSNCVVIYDTKIGDNSIITAGSVVTKDIPSNEVWGGVPAKKLTTIEDFIEKRTMDQKKIQEIKSKNLEIKNEDQDLLWNRFYDSRI